MASRNRGVSGRRRVENDEPILVVKLSHPIEDGGEPISELRFLDARRSATSKRPTTRSGIWGEWSRSFRVWRVLRRARFGRSTRPTSRRFPKRSRAPRRSKRGGFDSSNWREIATELAFHFHWSPSEIGELEIRSARKWHEQLVELVSRMNGAE